VSPQILAAGLDICSKAFSILVSVFTLWKLRKAATRKSSQSKKTPFTNQSDSKFEHTNLAGFLGFALFS
jgi:hypothetical protein